MKKKGNIERMIYLDQFRQWWRTYIESIDYASLLSSLISTIFELVITALIFWVVKKIVDRIVDVYFERDAKRIENRNVGSIQRNKTIHKLVENVVQYTYYFLLGYSILAILGLPVATLVAGAGVASLALGLGAQGFITDVVNGFFILLEHQFAVGDYVTIAGLSGTIISTGIRTTILSGDDGSRHFVPNRNIENVTNSSNTTRHMYVDLYIDPNADLGSIESVIKDGLSLASSDDRVLGEAEVWGYQRDAVGRLFYRVVFNTRDSDKMAVRSHYYEQLTALLVRNGYKQPVYDSGAEL
ncbi:mechanosensitive ion channel family protein [Aerococcus urinaeequi]|jgi:small-conductance mechanosensitive channel|uniref:mechanosensitive ion channel family protein n=3 Tax=Aerococcaceae TaxID=186827 RepID=UPI003D6BF596